jgi:L-iditol 2-dehydrogenase
MKAGVYNGAGDIRVEDHAEPAPTPENLIVKIRCCAICGTDLKLATIGNLAAIRLVSSGMKWSEKSCMSAHR